MAALAACAAGRASPSFGLANIDGALEESSVLDHDALRVDVAVQQRGLLQLDLIDARDVAVHLAVDHDILGLDIGAYPAIGSDHQVVIVQVDVALDFAIKIEIFTSRQFAFDDDRLADVGNIGAIGYPFLASPRCVLGLEEEAGTTGADGSGLGEVDGFSSSLRDFHMGILPFILQLRQPQISGSLSLSFRITN